MSIKLTYECETCKKQVSGVDEGENTYFYHLKDIDIELKLDQQVHNRPKCHWSGREELHFCSFKCIVEWMGMALEISDDEVRDIVKSLCPWE